MITEQGRVILLSTEQKVVILISTGQGRSY